MIQTLRNTAVFALLLANGACATPTAAPVFETDPMLHPPGNRIVFNRMCADEEPYRVRAYARMESPDGRARAVAAVLPGYRATGGKTVYVDVRLQRLTVDAGRDWCEARFTVRLVARSERAVVEGPEFGTYVESSVGARRFRTDRSGIADWMTFVEPDDAKEDMDRFHRFSPELSFTAADLDVKRPQDEFDLTLVLRNESNGAILELAGPRVRVPERIWSMEPPVPSTLGLLGALNPVQEGGIFDVVGRAFKYRECIENRRAAKRFLGPYMPATTNGDE